jgi:hypothetical protein
MENSTTILNRPRQHRLSRQLGRVSLLALTLWIIVDLSIPVRHDLSQFDARAISMMETAMWRSYYEKKPVLLFWQLSACMRQQFHAPFWRSFKLGYQATKAAFVFKKGKTRTDYRKALPALLSYYESIQALSTNRFDVRKVASLELEWWIIHRQREHYSYKALADALAETTAAQYNLPIQSFSTYARLRADAMRLRDESAQKPEGTTEIDWQRIGQELDQAWFALHNAVQPVH